MFLAYCCVCDINPIKSYVYYIKSKMAATYLLINSNCISKDNSGHICCHVGFDIEKELLYYTALFRNLITLLE